MNRRRPTRRIPNPSDFKAALAAVHITIRNRLEGTLISILVVAEKPSVAMSYAKVLGATSRQDGYLEGNGYLVSWCVGHLVELAPPNVYDEKYTKWSIADLPILPEKWQYLVSARDVYKRQAYDMLRKQREELLEDVPNEPDAAPVPDDAAVSTDNIERLTELIGQMKPMYRDPLRLLAMGYTNREIAKSLGLTDEVVRTRLFRGRKLLWKEMNSHE